VDAKRLIPLRFPLLAFARPCHDSLSTVLLCASGPVGSVLILPSRCHITPSSSSSSSQFPSIKYTFDEHLMSLFGINSHKSVTCIHISCYLVPRWLLLDNNASCSARVGALSRKVLLHLHSSRTLTLSTPVLRNVCIYALKATMCGSSFPQRALYNQSSALSSPLGSAR
jgi:hypothetical protein